MSGESIINPVIGYVRDGEGGEDDAQTGQNFKPHFGKKNGKSVLVLVRLKIKDGGRSNC
jgi:hypothetical protein